MGVLPIKKVDPVHVIRFLRVSSESALLVRSTRTPNRVRLNARPVPRESTPKSAHLNVWSVTLCIPFPSTVMFHIWE